MADDLLEAELTAEEILLFGPCVEAQVWTPSWLQEQRAPVAVAAGRPKFGSVFNSDGVGKMVAIRPCVSRGRRLRGLPPIYTPQMLEKHAGVFDGWPQFLDHAPAALAKELAKRGRSVKELGGQVLKGHWARDFVQDNDREFGYQKGGVVCEVWATPYVRNLVGENPNLLHTSINAWPTSGKPGAVPWRPGLKGMVIEGIRRQPQGSVDYVVRGGAGGRLLVQEGLEEEGAWPEIGEWSEDDLRLVVSVADRLYASAPMELTLPNRPEDLANWLQEHAPHLVPALAEADSSSEAEPPKTGRKGGKSKSTQDTDSGMAEGLTAEDVRQLIAESQSGAPTVEEFTEQLREETDRVLRERDEQRRLSVHAMELIENAEGLPKSWKADLKARYAMQSAGPPAALLVEAADLSGEDGKALTPDQVIEARVDADLTHVHDLIAEAVGRPRVRGEGARQADAGEDSSRKRARSGRRGAASSFWRDRFGSMGLAESDQDALAIFSGAAADDGKDGD